jgi:aspartate-semialdehyde dehydrogenase
MANAPGVVLADDVGSNRYPMPLTSTGKYDVEVRTAPLLEPLHQAKAPRYHTSLPQVITTQLIMRHMTRQVGRIRQSLVFGPRGLDIFVCGDQLLRGAASNAVFIAEAILQPERCESCVYVCMYVCMYVMYVYMYVCMYVCVCV